MPHQEDCKVDDHDNYPGFWFSKTRLAVGEAIKHAAATNIHVLQNNLVNIAEAAAADQHAYLEWQTRVNKRKLDNVVSVLLLIEKIITTIKLAPADEAPGC